MIINLTKKTVLVRKPLYESSFFGRCRGMIKKDFIGFDGMVLPRCSSIHTCFMSIAIDVVFVDGKNCICSMKQNLQPWRFAADPRARAIIELPVGAIDRADCGVNDLLDLDAVLSDEAERNFTKAGIMAKTEISCKYKSYSNR